MLDGETSTGRLAGFSITQTARKARKGSYANKERPSFSHTLAVAIMLNNLLQLYRTIREE